ncbi:hypothetical protein DITRI_Ditri16bG0150100 [Diplodiscus trichospermus]
MILELRRGQMLKRIMPLLTNKLFVTGDCIASERENDSRDKYGGHNIVWKFMLVDPLLTAVLQDLVRREDKWRDQMCEGKQIFLVNKEDNVESSEEATINNNNQGNHAETFYASDLQIIMTKDLPVRLENALDRLPFQELGEVMPHLRMNSGFASSVSALARM